MLVFLVEGTSNIVGWLLMMAAAQYLAGINNIDDEKKKKRSFQKLNDEHDHVLEAIQTFRENIPHLTQ